MKRLAIIIFIIASAVLLFSAFHGAWATQEPRAGGERASLRLETQFPAIEIQGGRLDPAAGPAQFVRYIFVLGLGLGGILAFAMIVFAGLEWSLSGANPSLQQDAKDRIFNAVFGLLLLLGSFVILNTINPDLVNLRAPQFRGLTVPNPRAMPAPLQEDNRLDQCAARWTEYGARHPNDSWTCDTKLPLGEWETIPPGDIEICVPQPIRAGYQPTFCGRQALGENLTGCGRWTMYVPRRHFDGWICEDRSPADQWQTIPPGDIERCVPQPIRDRYQPTFCGKIRQ